MFTNHPKRAGFWCISLLLNNTVFPKNCCFHTPSQNLNKGKCSSTSGSRAFELHWCIAPGIKPYQFVWTLIIWWCFGWEYFQTQIIYQRKSTLYRGHIRAICSKFIIINRLGSCRKLYNCKAFQKMFRCWYLDCLIPKQREIMIFLATALLTKIFAFLNNHS